MSKQQDISRLRSMISLIEAGTGKSEETDLCVGPSLSDMDEIDLADISFANGAKKASAFDRIVSMTARRFRSEKDIRSRLGREQYGQEDIDSAIERARACLLIDDARFADVLIRSRISAGKGKQGIEAELRREAIDPETVSGWPYDYFSDDRESEVDRAVAFLSKHPTRSKNPRQSAYRKLVQKGYSSSVASSASRIWCEGQ